jgi:hypothetical protein
MLHSKQLRSIKMLLDSNHGIYRRNRQFAPLAEQVCGYLMEPRPDAIVGIEEPCSTPCST